MIKNNPEKLNKRARNSDFGTFAKTGEWILEWRY